MCMNGQVPYSHIRKYLPGTYEACNVYFDFNNCFEKLNCIIKMIKDITELP